MAAIEQGRRDSDTRDQGTGTGVKERPGTGPDLSVIDPAGEAAQSARPPRAGRRWPTRMRVGLAGLVLAAAGGGLLASRHEPSSDDKKPGVPLVVPPVDAAPATVAVPVIEVPTTTEAPDPLQSVKDIAIKGGYSEYASRVTAETKHNTVVTGNTTTEVLNFSRFNVNEENMASTIRFLESIPNDPAKNKLKVNPHGDGPIEVKLSNVAPKNRYVIILDPDMSFRNYNPGQIATTFNKYSGDTIVMREQKGPTGDPLFNEPMEWANSAIANELANSIIGVDPTIPQSNSASTFENSIKETVCISIGKVIGGKQTGISSSAINRYVNSSSYNFDGVEEHDTRPLRLADVTGLVYPTAPAGPVLEAVA